MNMSNSGFLFAMQTQRRRHCRIDAQVQPRFLFALRTHADVGLMDNFKPNSFSQSEHRDTHVKWLKPWSIRFSACRANSGAEDGSKDKFNIVNVTPLVLEVYSLEFLHASNLMSPFPEPLLLKLKKRGKGRHDCMKLCVIRCESGPAKVPRSTLANVAKFRSFCYGLQCLLWSSPTETKTSSCHRCQSASLSSSTVAARVLASWPTTTGRR